MSEIIQVDISKLPKEQQEFIKENCLCIPQDLPKARCARRPRKEMGDNFFTTYYEWVSNPNFTTKQAIAKIGIASGTFYLNLKKYGLRKKNEVQAFVEFNKTLKQINNNELVLVKQMSCTQALKVIKQAIEVTELIPRWADSLEVFNQTVCVHILLTLGNQSWKGKTTKGICKELGINEQSYYRHLSKKSFKLYCSLVQQQIQFKG